MAATDKKTDGAAGNYVSEALTNFSNLPKNASFRNLGVKYLVIVAIASKVFSHYEGWSLEDAAYYCFITSTTIGLGDLAPTTDEGKLFNVVFSLVSIGIAASFCTQLCFLPQRRFYVTLVAYLVLGTVGFIQLEDYEPIDALRFSVQLVTTVGFGDIPATTQAGKWFSVVYGMFGNAVAANAIEKFTNYLLA